MDNLKTVNQLIKGECIVITEFMGKKKEYKGIFNDKLKVVYFTIPSTHKILGYIQ